MIFLVLLVGLLLRILNIDQSLWLDEAISANAAKNFSFIGIINEFSLGDTHPPGYYLLLKGWSSVFGYWEVAMRFLSVLISLLSIYLVYLIGKTISKKTGLAAATLLAVSPLHLYYSQEIRMYPVSLFLVTLIFFSYINAIGKNTLKYWTLFAFALVLLLFVDYLPMVVLLTIFIHILAVKRRLFKKFIVAVLPVFVFGFVWKDSFYMQLAETKTFLDQFAPWGEILGKTTLKNIALLWSKFVVGRTSFDNDLFYGVVLVTISIPFVFLIYKSLERKILLFWLWLLIPIGISLLGGFFVPGFSYFRLIFVLPAFYFILACGLTGRSGKWAMLLVVFISLFFDFYYITQKKFWREDWRAAVNFVEGRIDSNSVVLVAFPEPFESYSWYSKLPGSVYGVVPKLSQRSVDAKLVTEVSFGKQEVYTFDYLMDLADPDRSLFNSLRASNFEQRNIYSFTGVGQVRHWVKKSK